MTNDRLYLGVDVGTGSARAGIFGPQGACLGAASQPIQTFKPAHDFVEQSSDDIFEACGRAVRGALVEAGVGSERVVGVGFDATCSLVALDGDDRPVTVSPTGRDDQNIIVWMDHRAMVETAEINAGNHAVLQYVGGTISPEMQSPKLLWLKRHLPESWLRAARLLDLPDFLTYRATGVDVRSLCSVVCKWTYLGHEGDGGRWDDDFFQAVGLEDLATDGYRRIGTRIRPMGERVGGLTEEAAGILGLVPGTAVGVSIIDAHAGGLGLLGTPVGGIAASEDNLSRRLALIGGTSSCHMAVSPDPRFIEGVWGPYCSAMVPGLWLTEGGQSATGALIDHVIHSHARGAELAAQAKAEGTTVYALLNARLQVLGDGLALPARLTQDVHVYPDFHGNRSPRADATLRGMVSGLTLSDTLDSLAVQYLASVQAVAYGTRHIIEALNAGGYQIDTLIACGGDTKNPIFLREHADATGCRIALPKEPEAVLLGASILGAVASGDQPSVLAAMEAMGGEGRLIEPGMDVARAFHDRKYGVFQRMYEDQMAYRGLMAGGS